MPKTYQVTFLPENITIEAPEGTTLLMAANGGGIGIESPCGGRGTCGKCAVRIAGGGYALACKTRVRGDMTVEVPSFSRLSKHQVLLDGKDFSAYPLRPLCRKLTARLDPPDLSDNRSDLDRLKAYLSREYGINGAGIALSALRRLPAALRQGQWVITVVLAETGDRTEILEVVPGEMEKPVYGLAVDIGTTTVAVSLVRMETGENVDTAGTYNKQSVYGSDVISRIIYSDENADGLRQLQAAAAGTVNALIEELLLKNRLDRKDIYIAVCAGNTVMTHLFAGVSPSWLRLEPYIPAAVDFPEIKAAEAGLDIHPEAPVLLLPSVASYVGGDITAGVLSTQLAHSEKLTLFIDIGTNGELVLGGSEWLVACACSAGPAFEGSGIRCGMRAMEGAIDRVEIDPVTLEAACRTIGGVKPVGICGSGLIQALSELKAAGLIDRAGKIPANSGSRRIRSGGEGMEYVLAPAESGGSYQDIVITQSDIKNLLRAKGAIFAGIRTMLELVGMDLDAIEEVYIAGGFGNHLNIADAVRIGLLPDLPEEKYRYVGNSSLQGAVTVLLSKDAWMEIGEIAAKMTYLELSAGNRFMDEFISALFIPHTDLGLFPSVEQHHQS